MIRLFLLVFFLQSYFGSIHSSESDIHKDCPPFVCGKLGIINFPFTTDARLPHCGLLTIDGCDEEIQRVQLESGGRWYQIHNLSRDDAIIVIHDEDFSKHLSSKSCETFNNLTFRSSPFLSFQIKPNLTLLKCDPGVHVPSMLGHASPDCKNFGIFFSPQLQSQQNFTPLCTLIQLPTQPIPRDHNEYNDVYDSLSADFSLEVTVSPDCKKCFSNSGGECLASGKGKFYCSKLEKGRKKSGLKLGLVASASVLGVTILVICCLFWKKMPWSCPIFHLKIKTEEDQSIETFLNKYGPLAIRRYRYSEIKQITESFREKLGKGGHGGVFKGRLSDGRLVAVKVLKESEHSGEEFMNEVASISKTSHVNIVTLLGFCFEGHKRALIYEFMPNGSLEKYIHQGPSQLDHQLGWEKLYQIAIGIAQGLEYLHKGCNTRILHFDIKPHNILLDENLCPKISDFGLAKICLQRESTISMFGARGTPGYIAPEVFCRNFGGVSHKSDVYSYGMMVLEMVGGRKNISAEVNNSGEIDFLDWIYKRLELDEELGAHQNRNEEENQLARRMIIVSLWCIQTKPADRPPMSRVIEMLQGSFQPLTIPPRPCLSSPAISPKRSDTSPSTTSTTDT